jgi:hypothetical protein
VSIALRSKEDMEKYSDSRYKFALEMARVWFMKLKELKE